MEERGGEAPPVPVVLPRRCHLCGRIFPHIYLLFSHLGPVHGMRIESFFLTVR
jgi:hypothetical protein